MRSAGIDELTKKLSTYLPVAEVARVRAAFDFGAVAHEGQRRVSGEPYITHPVAVADILADLRMDANTIVAAILHDVLEDTKVEGGEVVTRFGPEVAQLVEGVSKLTQMKFQSKAEAQAENFRKMMLAMVQDIRVIMVKLADRLHNMRTLGAMPAPKRRRIARETLDIYVPLAQRLGMNQFRLELEDLGFEALHPLRYKVLERHLKRVRTSQKAGLTKIEGAIRATLEREGITAEVSARQKHLYSVYRKMRQKRLPLAEVLDVYGVRIVVDKVDTSYRALGVVHGLYKPVPGKFKDYVAIPKANGYQSLHTALFGPGGVPLEVQIRTADMDDIAESGIASHWLYKTGDHSAGGTPEARAREWLKSVMEMTQGAGSSLEFLENVKVDLFPDEVFVFSPQGDIFRLPRGATAVDFAYAVHSDIGNACVAAKIDRRMVPLRTPLSSGQTIEVVTAKGAKPNPAWLNFVVTAKARANIRAFLKNLKHEDAVALGKRLLERAFTQAGLNLRKIAPDLMQQALADFHLDSVEALYESVGLGQRPAPLVVRRFLPADAPAPSASAGPLSIKGTEGMVVSLAKCCHPIPGDEIMGYLSAGRGIVVHRGNCRNLAEYRNQPDKWLEVEWAAGIERDFQVEVRVDVQNERGTLAGVAAVIAEMGSNIDQVSVNERDTQTSTLSFQFLVRDRVHLAKVMRRIRSMPPVMRVYRARA
jgi:guanosine-3',5'-bis(diphosphate) 3'-pyrophosphohydrolase